MLDMLRVRELRKAKGLTQEALAHAAGVTTVTIQNVERTDTASTRTLAGIARALQVPIGLLFDEEETV